MYPRGPRYCMDSLTHAFLISAVAVLAGLPELIPFFILGAVIPDIDILFKHFSDPSPRYYIFTHGGFTHSLAGSVLTGLVAFLVVLAVSSVLFPSTPVWAAGVFVPLLAVIAGAVSHVFLDFLASPGIPVLYPLSDRKYSLHFFAGPSIFMFFTSIVFGAFFLLGRVGLDDLYFFLWIFIAVLVVRSAAKEYVSSRTTGRVLPNPNLLKWVIVDDRGTSVEVRRFQLFRGLSEGTVFPKFLNTTPEEISRYRDLPEVRRHRFYSYLSVARREGDTISFHDPLREEHYFWYPPAYQSIRVESGAA
jgi:inner membrane protein